MEDKREENKQVIFSEDLKYMAEDFGIKNQDGVKYALNNCQEVFGYISKAHQEEISNVFQVEKKIVEVLIKLSPALKESIVEYEVICCTGSRCAKNGSMEVLKTVREELGLEFGETSEDGRIRLTSQNCFKRCGEGPNMTINGSFHHRLDKDKARNIIKEIKN